MARPFTTSTGSAPEGTTKYGNLIVGSGSYDYANNYGGLVWTNGPNETNSYVIATAPLKFWGTGSNDSQFLSLVQKVTGQTFIDAATAKIWLESNGYWTSYGSGGGGGETTGNYLLLTTYSPATTNGSMTFPNHNASTSSFNPNLVGQPGYAIYINQNDTSGNSMTSILNDLLGNSGTLTLTQGANSAVYTFVSGAFGFGNYGNNYYWDNQFGGTPTGSLTLITPSATNFNSIDPINITVAI